MVTETLRLFERSISSGPVLARNDVFNDYHHNVTLRSFTLFDQIDLNQKGEYNLLAFLYENESAWFCSVFCIVQVSNREGRVLWH